MVSKEISIHSQMKWELKMSQSTIVNRYQILEKLLDQPNNEKSIKYENKF